MTQDAESFLSRAWLRRGPTATALWPLSLVFQSIAGSRRVLYRAGVLHAARLPVPVVVVGNIFVGGTGKTPLTIWLVQELRRAGFVPGVISRGYGGKSAAPAEVLASSAPEQAGDEPVLIARRAQCPVVVGRRRVEAARSLLARHPEVNVIVSDDGLQHYALARDVEIVLCDERGNGNGLLLPAGPLREPPSRPRDFTVYNAARPPAGAPSDAYRMQLVADAAYCLSAPSNTLPLHALASGGQRIAAAAGIGNPSRFFAMLRAAGLAVDEHPLADHYDFTDNPFARIDADIILITEKDAVKCTRIDTINRDPRIRVVPVTARIDRALAERIVEKCRGRPTA
ncbi:MAG TPA: tetraacyldisaccharide 4'-kinase [Noviherbaspirillum sp.]|uniref:tetraacyldisaccharide 4'-kinase n=1 Tax=Noviherbaspirillum sp. TaxID=1926288 RepID=UPI002D359A9C|nr:tetraacyldisaccharide 4'-kinase [Noviherbaspirillum sp.]HYD94062.1 tetraacyldisaccharide 4'-kinase [Noviherbaspirillum sp.]